MLDLISKFVIFFGEEYIESIFFYAY